MITKWYIVCVRTRPTIPLNCPQCNKIFDKGKHHYLCRKKQNPDSVFCCSHLCESIYNGFKLQCICSNCAKPFIKSRTELSVNNFCSRSCAATFNNKNKKHGNRRSKLEAFIEEELIKVYPNLVFHFNRKDTINSELDIYIPELNLAFELNGIFHYEPIYGPIKLQQIENNDNRKFQACLELNIELCIIDTSKESYFRPDKSKKYIDIITKLINSKL